MGDWMRSHRLTSQYWSREDEDVPKSLCFAGVPCKRKAWVTYPRTASRLLEGLWASPRYVPSDAVLGEEEMGIIRSAVLTRLRPGKGAPIGRLMDWGGRASRAGLDAQVEKSICDSGSGDGGGGKRGQCVGRKRSGGG